MAKVEDKRIEYCTLVNCSDFYRCEVKWGLNCIRQYGNKIPRLRPRVHNRYKTRHLVVTGAPGEDIRIRKRCAGDPYFG